MTVPSGGPVLATPAAGVGVGPGAVPGAWTQGTVVVDALRALRPEHRQVLADTWLRGRGVVEAAAAAGVPAALLTQRLHEALRALAAGQGGRRDWAAGAHVGVGAYLLRLLDADAERVFSEHMTSCPGCRAELTGLAPVVVMLTRARTQTDRVRSGPRAARAMAPGADVTPPVGFPRPDGAVAGRGPVAAPGAGGPPLGTATPPVRARAVLVDGPDGAAAGAQTRRTARAGLRARRAGRPRLLLPLAATVALLAAGGVVGADELGLAPAPVVVPRAGASDSAPGPSDGPSDGASDGPAGAAVRRADAADPRTGVAAEVEVSPAPPGTPGSRVSLSLTGLTGPRSCRLVALRGDGATQVLATWRVPASGFGTSRQPDPFTLAVTAAVPVADLTGLRVESVDAAGGSSVLVRLRL